MRDTRARRAPGAAARGRAALIMAFLAALLVCALGIAACGAVQETEPIQGQAEAKTSGAGGEDAPAEPEREEEASVAPVGLGPLHVSGARLVDARDTPVQLRGVSTHGLAWFPQYVNAACFRELHDDWHASVVRLALYTEEYGGYCTGGDQEALLALVRDGVRYATDAGLYAIVDWHILSDANPLAHADEAVAFFSGIAAEFGAQGNVLYEICNEPNGSTSWEDIKSYAERVIPAIREQDPDAVVVVGTPTWSQEVDCALDDPLPFDNVLYALHFYAATHKDELRERMVRCAQAGLPIFVSEFGVCDASGNGAIDEASADAWVAAMDELGISYCMWSLCNKDESASVLLNGCEKTSGFAQADLAPAGLWLWRTLTRSTAHCYNSSDLS